MSFKFALELYTTNIYYFSFHNYDEGDYEVVIENHIHSYDEPTCLGYKCDCGDITGEPNDEYHNPDYEENTCKGNYCLDCNKWYGEIADHSLMDEHTYKGLKSKSCECGYKVSEEIPMVEVSTPIPTPDMPPKGEKAKLSGGAIVGIVIGSVTMLGGLFALYWFILRKILFK